MKAAAHAASCFNLLCLQSRVAASNNVFHHKWTSALKLPCSFPCSTKGFKYPPHRHKEGLCSIRRLSHSFTCCKVSRDLWVMPPHIFQVYIKTLTEEGRCISLCLRTLPPAVQHHTTCRQGPTPSECITQMLYQPFFARSLICYANVQDLFGPSKIKEPSPWLSNTTCLYRLYLLHNVSGSVCDATPYAPRFLPPCI